MIFNDFTRSFCKSLGNQDMSLYHLKYIYSQYYSEYDKHKINFTSPAYKNAFLKNSWLSCVWLTVNKTMRQEGESSSSKQNEN